MKHDLNDPDYQVNLTEAQFCALADLLNLLNAEGTLSDVLSDLSDDLNAGEAIPLDKD